MSPSAHFAFLEPRFFPRLSRNRWLVAQMFSASDRQRAAHHRANRGLGILDLLLSLLRAMELVAIAAIVWRIVDLGASRRILSYRRLLRVALLDGAHRIYLLE